MERLGSWTLIALFAAGAAALVIAWAPGSWPNPIGQDDVADANVVVPRLTAVAEAVDAACSRGDQVGFTAATTASYRGGLERRLGVVDRKIDPRTLRAMASDREGCRDWLARPVWAMRVKGTHVGLAVQRSDRAADGAQMLVFAWDGQRFRLDEMRHATRVNGPADARRYLVELLRRK